MSVVADPVVLDPINQTLEDLATCLCSQIITDGLPPLCTCSVMPGNEVALDYAGDCDDQCGMAWVRLSASYPSTMIGNPYLGAGNCAAGIGLEIELGVMRCFDLGENGEPPDPATLLESSQLQIKDMLAMWRAIACCRQSRDFVIGTYIPYGPEGGLVGGILPVSILVT